MLSIGVSIPGMPGSPLCAALPAQGRIRFAATANPPTENQTPPSARQWLNWVKGVLMALVALVSFNGIWNRLRMDYQTRQVIAQMHRDAQVLGVVEHLPAKPGPHPEFHALAKKAHRRVMQFSHPDVVERRLQDSDLDEAARKQIIEAHRQRYQAANDAWKRLDKLFAGQTDAPGS